MVASTGGEASIGGSSGGRRGAHEHACILRQQRPGAQAQAR